MGERPRRVFLSFDHSVVDELHELHGVGADHLLGLRSLIAGRTAVPGGTRPSSRRHDGAGRCPPVSTVTENNEQAERVGRRMTAQREAAGLSKRRLAKLSGVAEKDLREWERGKHEPTARSLLRLIPFIGGTVEFYLDDGDGGAAA